MNGDDRALIEAGTAKAADSASDFFDLAVVVTAWRAGQSVLHGFSDIVQQFLVFLVGQAMDADFEVSRKIAIAVDCCANNHGTVVEHLLPAAQSNAADGDHTPAINCPAAGANIANGCCLTLSDTEDSAVWCLSDRGNALVLRQRFVRC